MQSLGGFTTPYGGGMSVLPGTMTPGFATSTKIDLNQIGEARNSMLGIKLDQVCTVCDMHTVCNSGLVSDVLIVQMYLHKIQCTVTYFPFCSQSNRCTQKLASNELIG